MKISRELRGLEGLFQSLDLNKKFRDRTLKCRPDNFQIDIEIAMRHAVSHAANLDLGMFGDEIRVGRHNSGRRLADHDQAHHHSLLRPAISGKCLQRVSVDEMERLGRGSLDVIEVVVDPEIRQIGNASART